MPRLNRDGSLWCAGIAGEGFFGGDFDGDRWRLLTEIHPAGMRAWLNDEEAITQRADREVIAVHVRTAATRLLSSHGAGEVFAGGGEWAAFLAGTGVWTSTDLDFPQGYVGAGTGPMRNDCVGPDGTIAIKADYHGTGPWHLYARDGSRRLLTGGDAANIQILGDGRAICRVGWTWLGLGVLAPRPLTEPAWNLTMFEQPDGWWLCYQAADGRVLVHPNGRAEGFVLGQATDAFGLDIAPLPDGRHRVLWATTEGEAPSSLVVAHVRLTDARVPLAAAPPPVDPPPPPPPPPEDNPVPDYQPIPVFILTVHEVWDRATEAQRRTHGWMGNAVAWELDQMRADGRRWYVNLKRGGPERSEDSISTPHDLGAGGWAIIDIVEGFGGPSPKPNWLDQTQATINKGEVGGGVAPTDPWTEVHPGLPPDPTIATLKARIAGLESELADCHREVADLRARPVGFLVNADYKDTPQGLIPTLKAAAVARGHFHGLTPAQLDDVMEETAHLCHRYIFNHPYPHGTPADGVIEEARLRGRGEWRDQW